MKKDNYICVVTIAGSDSSGGAGIQADIKTISATGCYAASVITALTAQNTQGVQSIEELSADFVSQQLESVFSDLPIRAVKIGMLHNDAIIKVVSLAISQFKPSSIILDPVMVAKDGSQLLNVNSLTLMKKMLFPFVTLITPNIVEAEQLIDMRIINKKEQEIAAQKLGDEYHINVLVKGGHLHGKQSSDVLYLYEQTTHHWFHAERIESYHTHGTGCSLSSAIASYLAQEYPLIHAVDLAKQYLTKAIDSGSRRKLGKGHGPVDHFYFIGENHAI